MFHSKSVFILILFFCCIGTQTVRAQPPSWDEWMQSQVQTEAPVVLQNRSIQKSKRFQIIGPLIGFADRRDFYTTLVGTGGLRYHFSETHGWEFFRVSYNLPSESALATEIREQTSFRPDVQLSKFQISSAYVYTPIYGKYTWATDQMVYLDVFATLGGGVRFANTAQPYVEWGLGMNHWFSAKTLSLMPEFRQRFYGEQRTSNVFVIESLVQLGVAWLL